MAKSKNIFVYMARLSVFTLAAISVGIVALIVAFAPVTNPSFLSSVLFRGQKIEDLKALANVNRMMNEKDSLSSEIYDSLQIPHTDVEFAKFKVAKPEKVKFKTSDNIELEGWYFQGSGPDTVLVCFNGFGKRLPLMAGYTQMLEKAGASVFYFDYRGQSDPAVKCTPQTAVVDGQAAYDYLTKQKNISAQHIILLGRDLGSYVCCKIASGNVCKALILENPWATVKEAMDQIPGAMAMRMVPESLYIDDCLNNIHLIKKEHPPILIATSDPEMTGAGKFYAAITPPKASFYVEDYMPTMLCTDMAVSGEEYTRRVQQLVAEEPLTAAKEDLVKWKSDYKSALAEAKRTHKPLLVEFGAQWCVYCRKMDQITYADAHVVAKINKDFVPVKLDLDSKDAQSLVAKYPFNGIPMVMVLDSGGNLKQKLGGFMGPSKFMAELKTP